MLPLLTLCLLSAPLGDAALEPRWMPAKSLEASLRPFDDPRRIVLKVVDDAGARAEDGRLVGGPALEGLREVLAAFPGVRVLPHFDLPPDEIHALRDRGRERSGRELADLTQYFMLELGADEAAPELLARLLALDEVENAYQAPLPVDPPGDIAPVTPDFTVQQSYRGPAPIGIDADYAEPFLAGTGTGITVVDLEYAWTLSHEDLSGIGPGDVIGGPGVPVVLAWEHHGTAVVGMLGADADASGVTGLVPDADVKVAPTVTPAGYNPANAILVASSQVGVGDVLLIEQQFRGPNSGDTGDLGMVPVEFNDAEFNTIRLVTALGIHVVEASGNGSQNLDSTVPPAGDPSYATLFDRTVRDSGAILVAAGTAAAPKMRLSFSNYGSRIDAFGWGQGIVTTGYGPDDPPICDLFTAAPDADQYYTACFGGTSGASPMVAAAAAILEAAQREAHSTQYEPDALRGLLSTVGTPSVDSGMGLQPDLRQQLPRVAAGEGLFAVYYDPDVVERLRMSRHVDVNGDGRDEWLLGRFEDPPEGIQLTEPGGASMMDGLTGKELFTAEGVELGDDYGAALQTAHDGDFDGIPDVLVGAPGGKGRVELLSSKDGQPVIIIIGEIEGEDFGATLARVGDVDGDGWDDYAVGAPRGDGFQTASGRVVLVSGLDGQELGLFLGEQENERFGASMALVDDLDGQGLADLAIGAPGDGDQFDDPGRVAIFSLETGAEIQSFSGSDFGERFGASLVFGPDFDDDGSGDLLVGAPSANGGMGDVKGFSLLNGGLGGIFESGPCCEEDEIGLGLAMTPDVDGDGVEDLLVGAPGVDGDEPDAGSVLVVSTGTFEVLEQYFGVYEGSGFGWTVAGGDLDGDGRGDVLAASFANEDGTPGGGAAYAFLTPLPEAPPSYGPPTIAGANPAELPVVVPDGPARVALTGTGLDTATRVTVDGLDVPPGGFSFDGAALGFDMPLVGTLGTVTVEVTTLGGSATTTLEVFECDPPALDLTPGSDLGELLPDDVAQPALGVTATIGGAPGDLGVFAVSTQLVPTVIPGVLDLAIGAGFTQLWLPAAGTIGPWGWAQLEVPTLPDLPTSYVLHFQGLVLDGASLAPPTTSTNVQTLTVE